MEHAISEGIKTMMVVVDDDVALPEGKGITGGRGVAGTIFAHKLAGALSNNGKSLEEIHSFLSVCVCQIGTLGVALTTCTVPGSDVSPRLADMSTMEVGLGIHGEPGQEQIVMRPNHAAEDAAVSMINPIIDRKKLSPEKDELIILINNLGGLSVLELQIVSKFVISILKSKGFTIHRALWGHYMTSLEMSGVSLSIFSIGVGNIVSINDLLSLVDAPCKACGWNSNNIIPLSDDCVKLPYIPTAKKILIGGPECSLAIRFVEAVCNKLIEISNELNQLDTLSGDGDCGITMNNLALSIKFWLTTNRENNPSHFSSLQHSAANFLSELADQVSASGGGTSGVLIELFLRAMCSHFVVNTTSEDWVGAMWKGCAAISQAGGARPGMRTMLDALVPGLESLLRGEGAAAAADCATAGMTATKSMGASAGRANYVPMEHFRGYADPGSVIVAEIFAVGRLFFI